MNRMLRLVLRDAIEMARERGRQLARVVLAGGVFERDVLRALSAELGLDGVEIEHVAADGPPRLVALELGGRAEALTPVSEPAHAADLRSR